MLRQTWAVVFVAVPDLWAQHHSVRFGLHPTAVSKIPQKSGRQAGHARGGRRACCPPTMSYGRRNCSIFIQTPKQAAKLDMPEAADKQRREKFVLSVAYSPGEGQLIKATCNG